MQNHSVKMYENAVRPDELNVTPGIVYCESPLSSVGVKASFHVRYLILRLLGVLLRGFNNF